MSYWVGGAMVTTSLYGAYQAGEAQDEASALNQQAIDAQAETSAAQLAFSEEQFEWQKEVYEDWKSIYGPIEENLGEFYANLTPENFMTAGLENYQKELQVGKTQMQENLAQKGMWNSGIAVALEQGTSISAAEKRAEIRRDAPIKVAEAQQGFVAAGKGGPTYGPTGTVGDVLASTGAANVNMLTGQASQAAGTASSMWGSAGTMLGTGLQYIGQNQPAAPTITTANQSATPTYSG